VEVRSGSVGDPETLQQAMEGITHVVHCAGLTKACRDSDYYSVNQGGTRNVVNAVNARAGQVERLVHISSLAAAGPAVAERPARETDAPRPVSTYGKSKLAAELEVKEHCRAGWVVLRPCAVYGPRDGDFLRIFKAIRSHVLPRPDGKQALSLVFVRDLAEAVAMCVTHAAVAGKTYFVAGKETVTARMMAAEAAAQMNVWTVPLPLPTGVLWPICLVQEGWSRLSGKASILSLQKYAELRAPGWVCDPTLLERETGCGCPTTMRQGIAETLSWYRQHHWL
jgi:nucleoside-diphosphate-sugar epimerase